MSTVFYEDMETLIPNTIMRKLYINGEHRTYNINSIDGYVLHDKNYDTVKEQIVINEEIGEESIDYVPVLGYHTGMVSCGKNYDFSEITMQDDDGNTVTAYGSRQFFTKLASEVPADQIFDNQNKDDVM